MKNFFKLSLPTILLVGVGLFLFVQTRTAGLIILFLFPPIFLIYILVQLKSELSKPPLLLKTTLTILVITNLALLLTGQVFKMSHYPGAVLFRFGAMLTTIASLIIGGLYYWKNRKEIQGAYTYEFILMLYPSLLFVWYFLPVASPVQHRIDYIDQVFETTMQLQRTNSFLYQENEAYDLLDNLKNEIIQEAGGRTEDGKIYGFFNSKISKHIVSYYEKDLEELNLSEDIEHLLETRWTAGDFVLGLTELQNEILLDAATDSTHILP